MPGQIGCAAQPQKSVFAEGDPPMGTQGGPGRPSVSRARIYEPSGLASLRDSGPGGRARVRCGIGLRGKVGDAVGQECGGRGMGQG